LGKLREEDIGDMLRENLGHWRWDKSLIPEVLELRKHGEVPVKGLT
jgi:hypothetical protein